jgi:hypothetical protein
LGLFEDLLVPVLFEYARISAHYYDDDDISTTTANGSSASSIGYTPEYSLEYRIIKEWGNPFLIC